MVFRKTLQLKYDFIIYFWYILKELIKLYSSNQSITHFMWDLVHVHTIHVLS